MDIIFRLRVVFWVLVLSLWGLIVKEFMFEESHFHVAKARPNAVSLKATTVKFFHEVFPDLQEPTLPQRELVKLQPPEEEETSPVPPAAPPQEEPRIAASPGPVPTAAPPAAAPMLLPIAPPGALAPVEKAPVPEPKPAAPPVRGLTEARPPRHPEPPRGFKSVETQHFTVFDQEATDPKLLETLESLHESLMLDLASFAPWAREEKVTIYLFDTQEAYQRATGRPAWSGGASSLSKRTLYAYKSEELTGILAHELTHIFFDGFFKGGKIDPLWLSEGMATLIQTERGLAAPNWLQANLEDLQDGGGYSFDQLMKVETTAGASDESVRLWYTQSYSVVRFLLRLQRGPSFFRFCRFMKEGQPLNQALLQAYGMPYNRVKALEMAWRYDVEKGILTARQPGESL